MKESQKKTLGQAIDEIIEALTALDELSRSTAVRAACEQVGISVPIEANVPSPEAPQPARAEQPRLSTPPSASTQIDIRTFKDQKQPASAAEMACIVAYYLDSLAPPTERKKDVSSADMEKYFKQGGYRLPKRMPQLLVDARAAGYFDSAGHGKYRLNPVGHNLVVHSLPKPKK